MARVKGGGHMGPELSVACVPDSTFVAEITALIAAGTDVVGKLVTLTGSNNYEVTSATESAIFDGIVLNYHKVASSYVLDVDFVHYSGQDTLQHTPRRILNLPYAGTLNLADTVVTNTTTYLGVKDGTTVGWGYVIATDVPGSGYVDVMF